MTGDGNTAVTTTANSTTTTTTTMEAATSTAPDLVVDDEHETKERVLLKYFLQEWDIVKPLLDSIVSSGGVSRLSDVQKIRSIMDKYQEQGELLEPYLESIISPLMFIIRSMTVLLDSNDDEVIEIIKPLGIIIYSLVTVCGYKSVIRFFPHHVSDLEPAVTLLEKCHHESSTTSLWQESTGEMEIKCIVLLWLYILVLVPFDISSVDSSVANTSDMNEFNLPPLVLKILAISKDYLSNAGPMRKISGLLLSRLLTRPDMTKAFSSFLEWTHEVLPISDNANPVDHFTLLGAVEALASIFKVGSRTTLLNAVGTIWSDISVLVKSTVAARSSLLRKYIMKLSQYIGLACLPHRSLSWQYVVRNTKLDGIISSSSSINSYSCISMHDKRCHEDDNMDIPEITEEIIELLLSGLKDSDTVVRWSAAKGIGRITARLTFSLLEDVLLSILELFSPGEGDGSWHGGCLALAELARRGLLIPSCLPKVVPVIVKALHYDVRRGPHSVGSHVRDAAAYVCWAFGRAYSRPDMGAIFEQLSLHLLAVACYDREVNCRRAAAAAFQENVGRQGSFPNGIYIVNTADYFSLSSRANSYLHIAANIAQFKEYLYPFSEELICHKIPHWDKNVRELAASALSVLVKYDQEYFSGYCLDRLLPCTLSSDLCTRHGATLAVGELVISLHRCGFIFSAEKQKSLSGIVPAIERERLYRGKGGEIMRSAVSRFIQCISLGRIHLTGKIKKSLLNTLNDNLKHPNAQIQCLAVDALKDFIPAYLLDVDGAEEDLTSKYFLLLKDPNAAARRGAALAVGILPSEHIAARWRDVLTCLSASCLIQENPDDCDAEVRVNSVHSLVSVCETLSCSRSSIFDDRAEESSLFLLIKNEVIHTLLRALDDYSVDNRGDVGSWVREAAIEGLEKCSHLLIKKDTDRNLVLSDVTCILFDANVATNIIGGIAKQAVEKLDKLREISIKALVRILYNDQLRSASIPRLQAIKEIIPNDRDLKWGVPNVSFPCLVKLLQFSSYSKAVLSGLVISVGGLQDSLRKTSVEALLEYIQNSESDSKENVREHMLSLDLLWILKQHQKTDRIIIPTLKTIEILFSKKIFMNMKDYLRDFYAGVLDSLTIELKATRDFSKLFTGLAILGYLSSLSKSTNILAFSLLLSFLAHRYPKIRKASADQVYLVILQNENLLAQSELGEALEVLTETCWEGDVEKAKEKRSQLVRMAGLKDARVTKESKQLNRRSTGNKDENVSYSSLVDFSGF